MATESDKIRMAVALATETKQRELMNLAIQASAQFDEFGFETYATIARQMAHVYGKALFAEHNDEEEYQGVPV